MQLSNNYLRVKPKGIVASISGDGTENGISIIIGFNRHTIKMPIVEIPVPDNHCDAVLEDITELKKDKYQHTTFDIRIRTSVLADTGGCIVWIKKPNKETIAVVVYSYALI